MFMHGLTFARISLEPLMLISDGGNRGTSVPRYENNKSVQMINVFCCNEAFAMCAATTSHCDSVQSALWV